MRIQPLILGSTALHSLRLGTDRGNASLGSRVLCRPRIRVEKQGKRQGDKETKTRRKRGKNYNNWKRVEKATIFYFFLFSPPPPPPPHRRNVVEPNLSACARSGAIVWLYPNIG